MKVVMSTDSDIGSVLSIITHGAANELNANHLLMSAVRWVDGAHPGGRRSPGADGFPLYRICGRPHSQGTHKSNIFVPGNLCMSQSLSAYCNACNALTRVCEKRSKSEHVERMPYPQKCPLQKVRETEGHCFPLGIEPQIVLAHHSYKV
jgi:hypothetical protein